LLLPTETVIVAHPVLKMVVKMRRCHLKKLLMTSKLFQGHQKQQTVTINRKLFENASSPVFAVSKIIRFYFIGVFPDFLDTLYVCIK
jgi:hypothetical protein